MEAGTGRVFSPRRKESIETAVLLQRRKSKADRLKPILRFLLDHYSEFGGDSVDQFHGDQFFAYDFDRLVEVDAALVDLEALGLQGVGQIGGGYGAEELVGLAGLARELHGHLVEQGGLLLRRVLFGGGALGERDADFLQALDVGGRSFERQLVR